MKTGIRWLNVVLHLGEQTMITSLLLGVHSSGAYNPKLFSLHDNRRSEEHRSAEQVTADASRRMHDDIERIAGMRAIDVDHAAPPILDSDDTAGSPILFVDDEILAAFDHAVETCALAVEDHASFDETRDSSFAPSGASEDKSDNDALGEDPDDDDIDWSQPMFVRGHRGQDDESSREHRLHADDPNEIERMHAAGLFGGALAPTESGSMVELMRHREPIQSVDFYVL